MGNSHQPLRILSHQQVIRAGQPLPSSVSFVGCFILGLKIFAIACAEVAAVFPLERPIDTVFLLFS